MRAITITGNANNNDAATRLVYLRVQAEGEGMVPDHSDY